jgi:ABC-type multidrug transport system ATPase subunit
LQLLQNNAEMDMINIVGVSKAYAQVKAVQDVSLTVNKGELFGLIGSDGAGKTTLFRILTTLLLPDTGYATVAGHNTVTDYKKLRRILGYMPGKFSLYQDLSVEENLNFFAKIFNTSIQQNYYLIKDIYQFLEPFKDRPAGKLSGGMKQKLALCCALIHKPVVLFLDEPTTGVDAVSRKEFWDMLGGLKREGITIFVSTPYMDEASLCERIALIQDGRIMKVDTPQGIRSTYPMELYALRLEGIARLLPQLRLFEGLHSMFSFGQSLHITFKPGSDVTKLTHYLHSIGQDTVQIERIEPQIEDCFMEMMQHNTPANG